MQRRFGGENIVFGYVATIAWSSWVGHVASATCLLVSPNDVSRGVTASTRLFGVVVSAPPTYSAMPTGASSTIVNLLRRIREEPRPHPSDLRSAACSNAGEAQRAPKLRQPIANSTLDASRRKARPRSIRCCRLWPLDRRSGPAIFHCATCHAHSLQLDLTRSPAPSSTGIIASHRQSDAGGSARTSHRNLSSRRLMAQV